MSNQPKQKFTAEDILNTLDDGFRYTANYANTPRLSDNLCLGASEVGKRPVWTVMHVALDNGQLFEVRVRETRW